MDRLIAIRSFVEVAKTGSFTQAANQLALSRLQVSRHVKEVESWLNQRLLHRTTRRVSLTSAGEDALLHCERILSEMTEMEMKAQTLTESLSGSIRIATPIGLAHCLLLNVVEEFTHIHPAVSVDLLLSDHLSLLVDERVDIALRFTVQPAENLIARRLMSIDTVICAAPAYLQQHGIPAHPNELSQHNCLIHLGKQHWDFVKDNKSYSVPVNGNIQANDLSLLVSSAVRGRGIVRLTCDLANPYCQSNQLIPLMLDYHIPSSYLWAVYLSRSYQMPVVRHLIDYIADKWKDDIKLKNKR
ncbi:LysR family transcriptional regulator [Zooshikella ganghwensis]|uniref:LysR family transcriptional regulator n=1 Tax=Zooshikella ganghwensis TaxID=202772 RepID=UPI00041F3F70|nr:LysR family transcriptional regulator [Zooshikella ganghwensis]